MRHLVLLPLTLFGALLAADEQDIRIAPVAVGRSTILVSAPGGGAPDAQTRHRLQQQVTVDWQGVTVEEALDFLRRSTGLNLVLATGAGEQAPPITFRAQDMCAETVVDWLARLSGLKISYLHEAIYLGPQVVRSGRDTRLYDVSDLTMALPQLAGPELAYAQAGAAGGGFDLFQHQGNEEATPRYDLEDLADILRRHVGAE